VGAKKDAAVSFLRLAASGRVREAYTNQVGAAFRHHNPFFAGDAEALMTGMEEKARGRPDRRALGHRPAGPGRIGKRKWNVLTGQSRNDTVGS
jgi:hypothetical protein